VSSPPSLFNNIAFSVSSKLAVVSVILDHEPAFFSNAPLSPKIFSAVGSDGQLYKLVFSVGSVHSDDTFTPNSDTSITRLNTILIILFILQSS